MGCASSSPLINGGGPGGVIETAKEAATKTANDVLHAGETAINDVGEHVKEAVQNVTHEIENVLGGKKDKSDHVNEDDPPTATNGHDDDTDNPDYQIIRLKGSKQNSVEDTEKMENMKNDLLTKAQSFGDDTDRMADDLMKETEDLMRDAETGIAQHEMTTRITSSADGTIEILNLEEPEIERILAGAGTADGTAPDSPKATLNTLSVPATKDDAMPMDPMPPMADKADVEQDTTIEPTSQPSIDRDSVTSSEEYFRMEVLKATSTHTPGRTVERRTTNTNRPPPPSTAAADRVQRFIFKLNSVILSDIEERVDEDGSIVRQLERNPDRVVELLSKSSLEASDNDDVDDDDGVARTNGTVNARKARRKMPNGIRRQQSISLDETTDLNLPERTKTHPNDPSSQRVRDEPLDQEQEMVPLRDIPPAVRLRALMRFKSLDASDRNIATERKGRRRMKSLDTIDANGEEEEEGVEKEETDSNTFSDVPYDPEEEERICTELLEELRQLEQADRQDAQPVADNESEHRDQTTDTGQSIAPNDDGHKTAWEKLQDYLQRVPKRRCSNYDLFYDSDEDTLKTLFKRHKLKLLFHYSDSSSEASDDTL